MSSQDDISANADTNLFASENWVCVEYDARATVDGPIALQDVTLIQEGVRRTLELKVCVLARVSGGKMDLAREYWDSASMAR